MPVTLSFRVQFTDLISFSFLQFAMCCSVTNCPKPPREQLKTIIKIFIAQFLWVRNSEAWLGGSALGSHMRLWLAGNCRPLQPAGATGDLRRAPEFVLKTAVTHHIHLPTGQCEGPYHIAIQERASEEEASVSRLSQPPPFLQHPIGYTGEDHTVNAERWGALVQPMAAGHVWPAPELRLFVFAQTKTIPPE